MCIKGTFDLTTSNALWTAKLRFAPITYFPLCDSMVIRFDQCELCWVSPGRNEASLRTAETRMRFGLFRGRS